MPTFHRELTELVDALGVELNGISSRLQFGRIAYHHEALRDRHRAMVAAVTGLASPTQGAGIDATTALILAETDEMVDAVNTLNSVLDQRADSAFAIA